MSPESSSSAEIQVSGYRPGDYEPFAERLRRLGLELKRAEALTLQVNVGLVCNQSCRHCHLDAGPNRFETMTAETVKQVAAYAERGNFRVIDITGGAPELHPNVTEIMERFSNLAATVVLRSNLTALDDGTARTLAETCRQNGVTIVASLPSLNSSQMEAQRGKGVLERSILTLRKLNGIGYGMPDSGLELNLVSNPTGAFLPVYQSQAEKKFRSDLERKWDIRFNNLYAFANVPLGRFRRWLIDSGNYETYMCKLASSFNPCTLQGVMCRTLVSVSWDGFLFDCDFNLGQGIHIGGRKTHLSEATAPPAPGASVAVSDHCYACTSGAGFT